MIARIIGIFGSFGCYLALISRGLDTTQIWLLIAGSCFIAIANWDR